MKYMLPSNGTLFFLVFILHMVKQSELSGMQVALRSIVLIDNEDYILYTFLF